MGDGMKDGRWDERWEMGLKMGDVKWEVGNLLSVGPGMDGRIGRWNDKWIEMR
jgi:hypothetical protein